MGSPARIALGNLSQSMEGVVNCVSLEILKLRYVAVGRHEGVCEEFQPRVAVVVLEIRVFPIESRVDDSKHNSISR